MITKIIVMDETAMGERMSREKKKKSEPKLESRTPILQTERKGRVHERE